MVNVLTPSLEQHLTRLPFIVDIEGTGVSNPISSRSISFLSVNLSPEGCLRLVSYGNIYGYHPYTTHERIILYQILSLSVFYKDAYEPFTPD